MNVVFLLGYVGSDPEVRTFANGDRVASISLATTKRWTDRESGERKSKTDWHRIRVYGPGQGGVIDTIQKYVTKGSRIRITGELAHYTSEVATGDQMRLTFVEVRRPDGLELLDPARGRRGPDDEDQRPTEGEEERPRRRAAGDEERPRRREAEDERPARRRDADEEPRRGRAAEPDAEPRRSRDGAETDARKPRDAEGETRKPRDPDAEPRKPRDTEGEARKPRDPDAEPRKPREPEEERPRRTVRDEDDDHRAAKPARAEDPAPAKPRIQDDPYIGIAEHGSGSEPPFDDFLADEYLN